LTDDNQKSDNELKDTKAEGVEVAKKRIYNPKTGKYYKIRERTTSEGRKGQIMGEWKAKQHSTYRVEKKGRKTTITRRKKRK
jgi:hypothetical protein